MSDICERFSDESQIQKLFLEGVGEAYLALSRGASNSNHSPKITTEEYVASTKELVDLFFEGVDACYVE